VVSLFDITIPINRGSLNCEISDIIRVIIGKNNRELNNYLAFLLVVEREVKSVRFRILNWLLDNMLVYPSCTEYKKLIVLLIWTFILPGNIDLKLTFKPEEIELNRISSLPTKHLVMLALLRLNLKHIELTGQQSNLSDIPT